MITLWAAGARLRTVAGLGLVGLVLAACGGSGGQTAGRRSMPWSLTGSWLFDLGAGCGALAVWRRGIGAAGWFGHGSWLRWCPRARCRLGCWWWRSRARRWTRRSRRVGSNLSATVR